MMEYPVPERHRKVLSEHLEYLGRANDLAAWNSAMGWLHSWHRYSKFSRDPNPEPGHGLVLVGPVGTGKTTIACAWLNHLDRETKNTTAFITDFQLATLLRQRYDDDAMAQVQLLQNVGCLVVDDLMRMGTHTMPLDVEGFLRVRENNGWPTILTVNTNVVLPSTLNSLLTTWTIATFEGVDLRDPENTERLMP
jgi:GTPase SAR1 family protein